MNDRYSFPCMGADFTVRYVPERQAPYCQNPSDPRYSDCGDDEEFEIINIVYQGIDVTYFILEEVAEKAGSVDTFVDNIKCEFLKFMEDSRR